MAMGQAEKTGNARLDALRARFDQGELFHSQLNPVLDEVREHAMGEIWIDKLRYKLEMPTGLVIVDGETSHVFNSEKNQVIISPYNPEEDDYAPSRFLYGSLEEYKISNGPNVGGNAVVRLTSEDAFALFSDIEIEISEQGEPLRITATDQSGNVIISKFSFGKFQPNDNTLFLLNYPKSAEIIDLRN